MTLRELKLHRNEHAVRSRPTRKEVQHFRNGSVRMPYEKFIYERTFMSEPIENLVILDELSNLNIDKKHLQKRHLFLDLIVNQAVFQHELYKVWETRVERLENLFSNVVVRVHVSLRICIVILRLVNIRLNPLRSTICKGLINLKSRSRRNCSLFSCIKVMCLYKSQTHVANYCKLKLSTDVVEIYSQANIYEWTYRESCYTRWSNLNIDKKHLQKRHHIFRRDSEPSGIPV